MSLKYLARIENESSYYIEKQFEFKSLTNLYKECEEAEKQIQDFKKRIMVQYNAATQTVERIKVIALRNKNEYSNDKRVKINVQVRKVKVLNGVEVTNDYIYGDSKEFSYQDKSEALLYVYNKLAKYPGSKYYNETPYKHMNI